MLIQLAEIKEPDSSPAGWSISGEDQILRGNVSVKSIMELMEFVDGEVR